LWTCLSLTELAIQRVHGWVFTNHLATRLLLKLIYFAFYVKAKHVLSDSKSHLTHTSFSPLLFLNNQLNHTREIQLIIDIHRQRRRSSTMFTSNIQLACFFKKKKTNHTISVSSLIKLTTTLIGERGSKTFTISSLTTLISGSSIEIGLSSIDPNFLNLICPIS